MALEQEQPTYNNVPPGFRLRHVLSGGHISDVNSVSWSPDGTMLASGGDDKTIRLWDATSGTLLRILEGHTDAVYIYSVSWAPDGSMLASGSSDNTIRLWDVASGTPLRILEGHTDTVYSVAWSPDGTMLASGAGDNTIRLWDFETGKEKYILEGHTDPIDSVFFSPNSPFLASQSQDGTVRIWHLNTGKGVAIIQTNEGLIFSYSLFHPTTPTLVTPGKNDLTIAIWDFNPDALYTALSDTPSTRYTNAKVVLVGDSGVGKSGLGLVLMGEPFVATESTHGRRVWTFESQEIPFGNGGTEMRETLLWDLAGQPGYRLIHQLHLNEVTVALIVFDARSETDPFAGVYHWCRALRLAQRIQGSAAPPMKVFLVAARMDRTGLGVSRSRVDDVLRELEIDAFFETSAKDGLNITELATAIRGAISWDNLPKVSSTDLFQRIKTFLITEKEAGRVLSTVDDLYHSFLKSDRDRLEVEDLRAQFETCIGRVESRGLIRRLNFGNLILLQPELLDAYASALVNAVKDEPDGLGSMAEMKVYMGDFPMSKDERLPDKEQEKLLLIAMVEDLLRGELALREPADDGPLLVFPSQSTRENPNLPEPEGKTLIFVFDGPVQNIYATLAVRLSHSGLFTKRDLWKDAVIYNAKVGGVCGVFLRMSNEGHGELVVFFDQVVREETRFYFEEYIHKHLVRWALPESIQRRRIFACSDCGFIVPEQLVQIRLQKGLNWINCPGCDEQKVWLLDREERLSLAHELRVSEMDRAADTQRDQGAAKSTLQGKIETNDFDVFLCHNNKDKPEVKRIGERLKEFGMYPWLDEWELQPGKSWQRSLEQQITQIRSAAVFVGKDGIGPWQQEELEAFLSEFVKRGCPVIPVLLPDAPKEPQLPVFLKLRTWVDFRSWDPLKQLVWGITGERTRMK